MTQYNKENITSCPVKEGDELDLKCISIGKKGDGIFKIEGFVIIIPETEVGKTYKVKLTKVLPRIGFAEVLETDVKVEEEEEPTEEAEAEESEDVESK